MEGQPGRHHPNFWRKNSAEGYDREGTPPIYALHTAYALDRKDSPSGNQIPSQEDKGGIQPVRAGSVPAGPALPLQGVSTCLAQNGACGCVAAPPPSPVLAFLRLQGGLLGKGREGKEGRKKKERKKERKREGGEEGRKEGRKEREKEGREGKMNEIWMDGWMDGRMDRGKEGEKKERKEGPQTLALDAALKGHLVQPPAPRALLK
ncbi:Cyclic nucleotide-gated cation channel beta-1, partial [Ophiophagus hannah]